MAFCRIGSIDIVEESMDMEVSGQLEHSSAQSGVTDRVEFKPDDFTQNIAIGKGK